MIFSNRRDAGKRLADRLTHYENDKNVLVLALPRGGVPVGYEVAEALKAPLDVFVVRKLGLPGHEELAMGAIASGGIIVRNEALIRSIGIDQSTIDSVARQEMSELARRETLYRRGRSAFKVQGKDVILVDDGLATGASMRAAIIALTRLRPAKIVVAVPVGSESTCDELASEVTELVCYAIPERFCAVGEWYEDFGQTSDQEVQNLLDIAARSWDAA